MFERLRHSITSLPSLLLQKYFAKAKNSDEKKSLLPSALFQERRIHHPCYFHRLNETNLLERVVFQLLRDKFPCCALDVTQWIY